ncbi:MAG: rhodanese-like domain-containing protein, partial [Blastocatellia bacterium]
MKFNRFVLAITAALLVIGSSSAQPNRPASAISPSPAVTQEAGTKSEIAAKDLKVRLDKHQKTIIVDARGSLSGQMIKGAVHVPSAKLDDWAKSADKSAFIVTYCTCPHDEAAEAEVKTLRDMGFQNAFSLKGGLNAAQG